MVSEVERKKIRKGVKLVQLVFFGYYMKCLLWGVNAEMFVYTGGRSNGVLRRDSPVGWYSCLDDVIVLARVRAHVCVSD